MSKSETCNVFTPESLLHQIRTANVWLSLLRVFPNLVSPSLDSGNMQYYWFDLYIKSSEEQIN